MVAQEQNKKRDFEQEILDSLRDSSFGMTITSIAEGIDTTRNTVYRYLALLEGKRKVFKKKVGRYVLYFSKEKSWEYLDNMRPTYKSLISNMKKEFPNSEDSIKRIGKGIVNSLNLQINLEGYERLESLKDLSNKELFELIKNILPLMNIFDNDVTVKITELDKENKFAIYQISNSNMLEGEEYLYHFHLLTGFLSEKLSNVLDKKVSCKIEKYEIFKSREDSYINISIEIL
ncbi:MAG: ArsR family transcriptional regulator [Promethearchaeota archaeon]|nr:MAG: ArsR family transcriptional regulator [Candidatus Lokiarchaeota archaeon]